MTYEFWFFTNAVTMNDLNVACMKLRDNVNLSIISDVDHMPDSRPRAVIIDLLHWHEQPIKLGKWIQEKFVPRPGIILLTSWPGIQMRDIEVPEDWLQLNSPVTSGRFDALLEQLNNHPSSMTSNEDNTITQ